MAAAVCVGGVTEVQVHISGATARQGSLVVARGSVDTGFRERAAIRVEIDLARVTPVTDGGTVDAAGNDRAAGYCGARSCCCGQQRLRARPRRGRRSARAPEQCDAVDHDCSGHAWDVAGTLARTIDVAPCMALSAGDPYTTLADIEAAPWAADQAVTLHGNCNENPLGLYARTVTAVPALPGSALTAVLGGSGDFYLADIASTAEAPLLAAKTNLGYSDDNRFRVQIRSGTCAH